jgi:Tol biopolymer transport system component
LLAVLALLAPSAHATFPGKNGKIAFATYECHYVCGAGPMYTINPDGGGQEVILAGETCTDARVDANRSPNWSADGSKLVFSRCGRLAVMNADGSGLHDVLGEPPCQCSQHFVNPSWSPDGSKIVYEEVRFVGSYEDGNFQRLG